METNLLEQLLNESESNYLDFKRDQYSFEGSDDATKSEILKDILAFANAWRRTDAYIMIGVEEVKGGRSKVTGVSKHLDDHSLQQFVVSKTQQPVVFSYIPLSCEGAQIGIIHIPLQSRPTYLTKDYGKLKKHVVYIRRGSSTAEASPDEIAKMGIAAAEETSRPLLELLFADIHSRVTGGKSLRLSSHLIHISNNNAIPDFAPQSYMRPTELTWGQANRNYYRQLLKYHTDRLLVAPVGFVVKNQGQTTAFNLRLQIAIEQDSSLRLFSSTAYPRRPVKYYNFLAPSITESLTTIHKSKVDVTSHGTRWIVGIDFGNVQPKADAWSDDVVYIGSMQGKDLKLEAQLFADNLPDPASISLNISFITEVLEMNIDDLEKLSKLEDERSYEELDSDDA